MIELFVCLNLSIKDSESFELDDFLYLFDNFKFMLIQQDNFDEFLNNTFKFDF